MTFTNHDKIFFKYLTKFVNKQQFLAMKQPPEIRELSYVEWLGRRVYTVGRCKMRPDGVWTQFLNRILCPH